MYLFEVHNLTKTIMIIVKIVEKYYKKPQNETTLSPNQRCF